MSNSTFKMLLKVTSMYNKTSKAVCAPLVNYLSQLLILEAVETFLLAHLDAVVCLNTVTFHLILPGLFFILRLTTDFVGYFGSQCDICLAL